MPFDWSTLALQTINFVVLVWLLHRFLYKPVLRMVDARRAEVERNFAEAEKAAADAKAGRDRIAAERTAIADERAQILKSARTQADEAAKAKAGEAERAADKLLEEARGKIAEERRQALAEARRAALDLGADLAGRLLEETPAGRADAAWLERIESHVATLPPSEREALKRQLADGGRLRVVTASPLADARAAEWRQRLESLFGGGTIAFAADRALIAGAELIFPDAVLRFSWRDSLKAMQRELSVDADDRR